MGLQWYWIPLGTLAALVLYQQFRIFQIDRVEEERRAFPDRDRERRRHDCSCGCEGTAAL